MAFFGVNPGLVCARWAFHLEFSAPTQYDHKVNLTKHLCLRPKIAVCLGDRWALPDSSGTRSLNCLHVWKVLDIRLNICER